MRYVSSSLSERYESARTAVPNVVIPREVFESWLSARDDDEGARSVHDADSYLACACAMSDPVALKTFHQRFAPELAALHRRFSYLPGDADDFRQRLYEQLFTGNAPKIAEYTGRGELRTWLRVALTRMLVNSIARESRELPAGEEIFLALPDAADPETVTIRKAHAETLRAAFVEAVDRIGYRDRNMLRYAFVQGLGIEAIAKLYSVHRATASRWFGEARDKLANELRSVLRERLRVSNADLDSILRSMLSQLDVSATHTFIDRLAPAARRQRDKTARAGSPC